MPLCFCLPCFDFLVFCAQAQTSKNFLDPQTSNGDSDKTKTQNVPNLLYDDENTFKTFTDDIIMI